MVGPAEPIEVLAVEVVGKTDTLLSDIEKGIDQAAKKIEVGFGEIEQTVDGWKETVTVGVEETSEVLEGQGDVLTDLQAKFDEAKDAIDDFSDSLDFQEGLIQEHAKLNELVNETLGQVVGKYRSLGKEIPRSKMVEWTVLCEKAIEQAYQLGLGYDGAKASLKELGKQLADTKKEADQNIFSVQKFIGQLKALGPQILATYTLFKLLQKGWKFMVQTIKEGIREFAQYAEVNFKMESGVRSYQQAVGVAAGSQQEWSEFTRELADRFNMATEEAQQLTAQTTQLAAQYNLTKQEAMDLEERSAALGKTTTTSTFTAFHALTQYITKGTIPQLRGLNLNLNDTELQSFAASKGIKQNVKDLTEAEQRALRYAFALEQTNFALETADELAQSHIGRMEDLRKEQEKAKEAIGALTTPLQEVWETLKTRAIQAIGLILAAIVKFAINSSSFIFGLFTGIHEAITIILEDISYRVDLINQAMEEGLSLKERAVLMGQAVGKTPIEAEYGTIGGLFGEKIAQEQEKYREMFSSVIGELTNMEDAYGDADGAAGTWAAAMGEHLNNLKEVVKDLSQKWTEGIAKIEQSLSDALDDIELTFRRKRRDMEVDLLRDLEDINRDAMEDRAQAYIDYQIDELRAKEDHLREMKYLEMQYLFDLEDAVRERDARRVIDLMKRYKLEKDKREDDYDLAAKRREEDFQLELRQIERNRQRRQAERILEFQQEMEDLAIQEAERVADREERARRELRDLRRSIENKLMLEAQGMTDSLNLTQEYTQELYEILNAAFGEGGFTEELIERYNQLLASAGGVSLDPIEIVRAERGLQRGGSIFATRPTLLSVGEGRPERVDITPLSAATGRPSMGYGGAGGEPIQIEMSVDADDRLVVEVADQAMGSMAEVFVSINRRARRMG